jgi:hypothetical protein
VDHLVQRVIERRDRGDHALQRLAQRVHAALLAMMGEVARETLAVVDQCLLRREQQHVAGAAHFVEAVFQAQARLEGDLARNRLLALRDQLARARQDAKALVARQLGLVVARDADRAPHIVDAGARHGGHDLAGVWVVHGDHALGVHLVAGDAHRLAARVVCRAVGGGRDGHLHDRIVMRCR